MAKGERGAYRDRSHQTPQRFRFRTPGWMSWRWGVCIPETGGDGWETWWTVRICEQQADIIAGTFGWCPDGWFPGDINAMQQACGDMDAFEWVDNDYEWAEVVPTKIKPSQ